MKIREWLDRQEQIETQARFGVFHQPEYRTQDLLRPQYRIPEFTQPQIEPKHVVMPELYPPMKFSMLPLRPVDRLDDLVVPRPVKAKPRTDYDQLLGSLEGLL